uniref:Uncharacterized protein n=1 Tax=Pipistrellus kuhlii TaxID=59472 RepID=A0A7J7TLT2_PIPKU|nr:hypothetical protein mPipKuh1_009350 [Pipistrellus kuhlii]
MCMLFLLYHSTSNKAFLSPQKAKKHGINSTRRKKTLSRKIVPRTIHVQCGFGAFISVSLVPPLPSLYQFVNFLRVHYEISLSHWRHSRLEILSSQLHVVSSKCGNFTSLMSLDYFLQSTCYQYTHLSESTPRIELSLIINDTIVYTSSFSPFSSNTPFSHTWRYEHNIGHL